MDPTQPHDLDFTRFEVLSFDCYGTLIDWESGILSVLRPIFDRHGLRIGDDQLLAAYAQAESDAEFGLIEDGHPSYRLVLERTFLAIAGEYELETREGERQCIADSLPSWRPFPDTVASLRRLAERYDLAIISNIDEDLFEATREQLGVDFAHVVTAEAARAYKPAVKVFRVALERFGIAPDQLLHVAQSLYHDIAPISTLGVATVHVDRRAGRSGGATPKSEARASLTVPDLASLADLVDHEVQRAS